MPERDLKTPKVSPHLVEYLRENFTLQSLLGDKSVNNDEAMGFLRGAHEVINHLASLVDD